MDHQHSFPVVFLHLIRRHQLRHAHGLPAGLAVPQHRVHRRHQRSDVSLLPFDPVQDLWHDNRNQLSFVLLYNKRFKLGILNHLRHKLLDNLSNLSQIIVDDDDDEDAEHQASMHLRASSLTP